jgi:hypothetical protein
MGVRSGGKLACHVVLCHPCHWDKQSVTNGEPHRDITRDTNRLRRVTLTEHRAWCTQEHSGDVVGNMMVEVSHNTPIEARGERIYSSYSFISSAVDGGEWSSSRPGRVLPPGKGPPGTNCTGSWVGPRAGVNTEDRGKIISPLLGIEPRSPGCPIRSQALY